MNTVEFLVKEYPDGRLMLLIIFREGKNFRIHRNNGETYYTWCPHEADVKMTNKLYEALDRNNKEFKKKQGVAHEQEERRDLKKDSDLKLFYT